MLALTAAAWLLTPVVVDSAGGAVMSEGTGGALSLSLDTSGASAPAITGTSSQIALPAPTPVPPPPAVIGGDFASPFEPFVVDSRVFSRLPFDPTDIGALANLSPAATDGGDLGTAHPSIAGGTGFENRWYVDGFEVTDPGVGSFGPWRADYGALGWPLPLEWVDRVSVTDAAPDVSRGGAGGGAIDIVLPSREDRFEFGASYALRPTLGESPRRNPPNTGVVAGAQAVEQGLVHAGGALVPDHLWFLAGVGFGSDTQQFSAGEGYPLEDLGKETQRREHLPHLAKVTLSPVHGHTFDFLWMGDRGGSDEGMQRPDDLLGTSTIAYSALRFTSEMEGVRYQAFLGSSTDVEVSLSRMVTTSERMIRESADRHRVADFTNGGFVVSGGIGFYERSRKGESFRGSTAVGREVRLAGIHHLRAGAGVDRTALRTFDDRSGSPVGSFRDEDGDEHEYTSGLSYQILDADDASTVYRVIGGSWGSPIVYSGATTLSAFVEDRWSPFPAISVAPALRAEQSSLHGGGPHSTSYSFPAMFSPRLAVEWAPRPLVVAGFEGARVVTPVPLRLAERRMSGRREVGHVDYSSSNFTDGNQIPDGTVPVNGDTVHSLTGGTEGEPVLRGTGLPYYDELALAVRWNPFPAWRLDARYVHREIGRIVDDVASYATLEELQTSNDGYALVITNPGSDLDGTCSQSGCWQDPQRVYDAIQLAAHGAIGKVDVLATWRISRLFGNYEGVWQTDGAVPAGSPAFDYPNSTPLATDGKSGPLPLDRTHVISVAGAYDAPYDVQVGAIAWLRSGRARTEWVGHPFEQRPTMPHRGWGRDGREPGSASLDLRASWTRPLSPLHVTAAIDVINVFDSQTVTRTSPWREYSPGETDPAFGHPLEYAPPRSVRLTIRGEY